MPMRATTVRFDESLWALLEREARAQGVSAAQFVRDAAILRVASVADPARRRGHAHDGRRRRRRARVAAAPRRARRRRPRRSSTPTASPRSTAPACSTSATTRRSTASPGSPSRVLDAPIALVSLVDRRPPGVRELRRRRATTSPRPAARRSPSRSASTPSPRASRSSSATPASTRSSRPTARSRSSGVIAYAGIPLIDPDGYALGTLCVADDHPRSWTTKDIEVLTDLAASVLTEIKLRRISRT